jgi:hypothetical protein
VSKERKRTNISFTTKYRIPNLAIEASLIGATHLFLFESAEITIRLPEEDLSQLSEYPKDNGNGLSKLSVYGWKGEGTSKSPILYAEELDVEVDLSENVLLHPEMLKDTKIVHGLLTKNEEEVLEHRAEEYQELADRAFEYWLKILRLVKRDSSIGRSTRPDYGRGFLSYIRESKTFRPVWSPKVHLKAEIRKPFSLEQWDAIQRRLKSNDISPLYYEYYFDGILHKKEKDTKRAVIDFAVSCEVYLRNKVTQSLPMELEDSIVGVIDEVPIRRVIENIFPTLLSSTGKQIYKKLISALHQLFDERNKVLHEGTPKNLSEENIERFFRTSEELLRLDDDQGNWI